MCIEGGSAGLQHISPFVRTVWPIAGERLQQKQNASTVLHCMLYLTASCVVISVG